MRPRALQHRCDAAGDRDVVVLDQDRIVEPEAVIEAAAAAHGIFLERAQARRGLAGAADAQLRAGGMAHIIGGERGDAGQPADEIQRGALAGQHRARRARNRQHVHAGGDGRAVAIMRLDVDIRRQLLKRRNRQRQSGDHAGLPRDQDGVGLGCFRNGGDRGDVAGAAEILIERALHRLVDGERRQKRVRMQQRGWCCHDARSRSGDHRLRRVRAGARSASDAAISRAAASVVMVRCASAGFSAG